jgi:hypothetical protein
MHIATTNTSNDLLKAWQQHQLQSTHEWFDDASTRHVGGYDLDGLQAWQHAELWRQHACDTSVVAEVQLRQAVRQPATHTATTPQNANANQPPQVSNTTSLEELEQGH